MKKQSEMTNEELFEDLLEKVATGRYDEIEVSEEEEPETYLVAFDHKTEQKSYEEPYDYEGTGRLFYEQMKEVDRFTNVKLFAVKPSGERVLLAE